MTGIEILEIRARDLEWLACLHLDSCFSLELDSFSEVAMIRKGENTTESDEDRVEEVGGKRSLQRKQVAVFSSVCEGCKHTSTSFKQRNTDILFSLLPTNIGHTLSHAALTADVLEDSVRC